MRYIFMHQSSKGHTSDLVASPSSSSSDVSIPNPSSNPGRKESLVRKAEHFTTIDKKCFEHSPHNHTNAQQSLLV